MGARAGGFGVPLLVLLSRRAAELRPVLAGLCALIALVTAADALWSVVPPTAPCSTPPTSAPCCCACATLNAA
ncbi:MAG: hypothetical protein R3F59_27635 [Myxococcota bacterium]